MSTLAVHKLHPNAILPRYATAGAAGMDLSAALDAPITLAPGQRAAFPTGLAFAIPAGYEGQIRARSGLARTFGIACVNAPGTLDSDYRGEVQILLVNLGDQPWTAHHGDRIAQLVIARCEQLTIEAVESLEPTARGEGGFGSTGR